jgi:general nucleoside transport system ATP-binding protein
LTPLLEVRGLTKSFGSLRANDHVSFSIFPDEIVGIVGENGAGKSTLVKLLGGVLAPDSGEIFVAGAPASLRTPADAQRAGIALVHQHFNLISSLSVEENLVLGRPDLRRGILRFRQIRLAFQRIAEDLGTQLPFSAKVSEISVGGCQQVELIKALSESPRLLILDEPTAVLPPSEREHLLRFIRRLKARGTSTILISHKLDDLYDCCDRAIVMRAGAMVGESDLRPEDRTDLIRMIVGAELPVPDIRAGSRGEPAISVRELVIHRADGTVAIDRGSFDLHAGEIVALCGVEGNGQTELLQALAGMVPTKAGEVAYATSKRSVGADEAAGHYPLRVAHIPEDRLKHGVVGNFTLTENWLFRKLGKRRYASAGFLRRKHAFKAASEAIVANDVRASGPRARMSALSGGNQQKFVIARELEDDVAIILAGQPTRGLDLRTVAAIRNRLVAERARGAAILLVSADLSEVWDIADRVMVVSRGRLRGPVPVCETSLAEVGRWMTAP